MTSNAIKLSLDRLSSDISARLNEIASQSRDMQVASLVREVERQIPDAQIVVGETPSRSVVDIVNDGDDPAILHHLTMLLMVLWNRPLQLRLRP